LFLVKYDTYHLSQTEILYTADRYQGSIWRRNRRGLTPTGKNRNPGCKFPPKVQPGSFNKTAQYLRRLNLLPQNPTPTPEISHIEPCP